ncbi:MAG: hypothetical protein NTW03_10430 [Verrucomicrobia bacterium]|nr:hypothetical protein [Verrucomicrobiota bacterium]
MRDELGDPITSTNAQIVFQTSAGTTLSTTIVPFLGAGINYRLKVPMDAGLTADNYQGTAQRSQVPFLLTVKIGPTTYHPIQMQGGYANLGKPGQKTWLDLTLGEDTLGDGLPDAWKWMVLQMSDGYYTDICQIRPNDRFPGYPMTMLQAYIAGTYVWDPSDVFSLLVVGMNGHAPVVRFQAVQGRSYSIAATTDFHQWSPVQVRQAFASSTSLMNSYVATGTGQVQLEVPPSTSSPTNRLRFFRAAVQ